MEPFPGVLKILWPANNELSMIASKIAYRGNSSTISIHVCYELACNSMIFIEGPDQQLQGNLDDPLLPILTFNCFSSLWQNNKKLSVQNLMLSHCTPQQTFLAAGHTSTS